MINYSRIVMAVFILLCSFDAFAQKTDSDSSSNNQQIKQQAVEMRNKVNKYIAEKLNMEESVIGNGEIIDSIISRLSKQDDEIDALNKRLQGLEKLFQEQAKSKPGSGSKKIDSHHYADDATVDDLTDIIPGSYAQIGNNKLLVFYAFDAYILSAEQVSAISEFVSNKDVQKIDIQAYTDTFGSENYNNRLAVNRCRAVLKSIPKTQRAKMASSPKAGCGAMTVRDSRKCRRAEIILIK
jgi:outer membrane protein OmpA-like peptidoglycan-associated protein